MALGGDKLTGSTGGNTSTGSTGGNSSTGNRPSRNDRNDSNPYSQYQEAMQEAGLNNMSGNTNATYGDGTTHGNNNPDGVGGLPVRNDNSSSGGGNGSSVPAPAPKPQKPQKPKTLSASETLAKIAREEWEDWKKRFQPRIEDLARQASTGELTKADIGRADQSVTRSFDRAADAETMRTNRLGIQRDGRQQAASDRMLGLNETATRASVRNNTRIAGQDRDMQILAGGGNIGLGANQ